MTSLRFACRWPTATLVVGLAVAVSLGIFVAGTTRPVRAQPKKQATKAATAEILTETDIVDQVTGSLGRSVKYMAGVQIRDGSPMDGAWDDCNAPNALA
ncbi:MAG TPA: hypothetical protein DER64_23415, partial [Planctomycetaceae bacterium]|nr:hypothetical protein [Planctomycetaceae bacterium]